MKILLLVKENLYRDPALKISFINFVFKVSDVHYFTDLPFSTCLGDLAIVIKQKRMQFKTNQKTTLFLNEWPRKIAETMATVTKFIRFSVLIVLFSL